MLIIGFIVPIISNLLLEGLTLDQITPRQRHQLYKEQWQGLDNKTQNNMLH